MSTLASPGGLDDPLKVCPRCSTISQTAESRCPSCGKGYRRRNVAMTVILTLLGLWAAWVLFSLLAMALISTGG